MEHASTKSIDRAKLLRRDMTKAEKALWYELRAKRFAEIKFRRQHPIHPYIVDFACVAERLIIEIDGATHGSNEEQSYDAQRTKYLQSLGWIVIRFSNDDVFNALDGVLDKIIRNLPSTARAGEVAEAIRPKSEGACLR